MSNPLTETNAVPAELRPLPEVTAENEHFWRGGAEGELRFLRCQDDGYYLHPAGPVCPLCLGKNLEPEAVSGRASVLSFTVNHQPWYPGLQVPYVIAVVSLPEQDGLHLTTNIVNCDIADVEFDMDVQVVFLQDEDVWLPLFEPRGEVR